MLDSTFDLFNQAVSNNLYVFCIFNLIIIMIVMGSKHGSNGVDEDYKIPLTTSAAMYSKQDTEVKALVDSVEQTMISGRVSAAYESETATEESKGNGDDFNGFETDATDEDDELRRRVEEFIAKVNREWRAEKLGI